jgi:biopolymer transport protein ExbD
MHDISLTPIIDVALTLLVIFIMTAPVIQNAIKITLPKGAVKEDGGVQEELIVYIDKESKLFFNNQYIDASLLTAEIQKKVQENSDKTIFVKADQGVSYGTVIELVDSIKQIHGVAYVALATQKRT